MAVSLGIVLSILCQVFLCYLKPIVRIFNPVPPADLRGKKVLITGAAGGIGDAIAREFYKQGCVLVLWDLDKARLFSQASSISTTERTVFPYVCDVTNKRLVKEVASQVRNDVGEIDILVNNAGIYIGREFLQLDENTIRKVFEVNILSHFTMIQEFLPAMISRNSGGIVSVSSMAGVAGAPLACDYSATKHAVNGMHDSLSEELRRYGKDGITTHVVCPLFITTPLITNDDITKRLEFYNGIDGDLQPQAVGEAVVEGVRRNRRRIWVPRHAGFYRLINLILPDKVNDLLWKEGPKLGIFSKSTESTYN